MSAHFLAEALSGAERAHIARQLELLTVLTGALVAHLRPAPVPRAARADGVSIGAALSMLENTLVGAAPADRLRVARGRGLPGLRVDADALHQVLLCVIGAALADESVRRRVRVTARAEGSRVCLAVVDDGARLEMPDADASGLQGRALALALVREVAGRMGGRVRLAPRSRGNQLEIWLPAAREAGGRGTARRPRAARAAPRRP